MSSKEGYVKTSIPFINKLFRFKIFIILANWTFQGMLYADKTERSFRLLLDAVMIIILSTIFINLISNVYVVLILSFFVAHTINWIFNGQLFVLGRYIGIKPNKQDEFCKYAKQLTNRAQRKKGIDSIALYGSTSRKQLSKSSDLDVRIIRKTGILNGLNACWFALLERSRAFFNRFPLDVYVLDSTDKLGKIRKDEKPIILYDSNDILAKYYAAFE